MKKSFSKIFIEKIIEKKRDSVRAEEQRIARDINVAVFHVDVHLKHAQDNSERVDRVADENFYAIE